MWRLITVSMVLTQEEIPEEGGQLNKKRTALHSPPKIQDWLLTCFKITAPVATPMDKKFPYSKVTKKRSKRRIEKRINLTHYSLIS